MGGRLSVIGRAASPSFVSIALRGPHDGNSRCRRAHDLRNFGIQRSDGRAHACLRSTFSLWRNAMTFGVAAVSRLESN